MALILEHVLTIPLTSCLMNGNEDPVCILLPALGFSQAQMADKIVNQPIPPTNSQFTCK